MALQTAGQPITAATINRQYTLADGSNTTVSGTTASNLCTAYSIPGSDASQFTTYRLSTWGVGVWGSTAQKLTLNMAFGGLSIGTAPSVAAAAFAASAVFNWKLVLEIMCTATGSTGTWAASLSGFMAQTANNLLPGTAADNSVAIAAVTGTDITQDSTVSNSLSIQAAWASVTGAPTITAVNTMFERLSV